MNTELILIGAPSSAGAHAPGQEKAPFLLREAGILDYFAEAGLGVSDSGYLPGFRYKNDPSNPRARNVQIVADNARRVADTVAKVLNDGKKYIVLGGDCTNGGGPLPERHDSKVDMADPVIEVDGSMVKFNIFRVHRHGEILAVNLSVFGRIQLGIVGAQDN